MEKSNTCWTHGVAPFTLLPLALIIALPSGSSEKPFGSLSVHHPWRPQNTPLKKVASLKREGSGICRHVVTCPRAHRSQWASQIQRPGWCPSLPSSRYTSTWFIYCTTVQQAAGPAGDLIQLASPPLRLSRLEELEPGHCSEPQPPNQSPR